MRRLRLGIGSQLLEHKLSRFRDMTYSSYLRLIPLRQSIDALRPRPVLIEEERGRFHEKRVLYSEANYAAIVREQGYFVDKTPHIVKLERVRNPVFLRPRRFGKSLFCFDSALLL